MVALTREVEVVVTHDRNGNPIVNSAGEPFHPAPIIMGAVNHARKERAQWGR